MDADTVVLGTGTYRYAMSSQWGRFPEDMILGDVAAIAVDADDNVYLFTRGTHPMIVLNRDGDVLRIWGHGIFRNPHGLDFAADGMLYCTDDGDHTVRKCTPDGDILLTIGIPGRPTPFMSNRPFNRCTHSALAPNGDILVSDGYQNACIHRFSPDGRHLATWGKSGTGPGEFYIPHNLVCDADGWIYVADRENHRIQVFANDGRFETEWHGLHRPCGLCMNSISNKLFYVGEAGPAMPYTANFPNLAPRVTVLDQRGAIQAQLLTGPPGIGPGRMIAPHGIAVDSQGNVYVGEVSINGWKGTFPDKPMPAVLPSLHKLVRLRDPVGAKRAPAQMRAPR